MKKIPRIIVDCAVVTCCYCGESVKKYSRFKNDKEHVALTMRCSCCGRRLNNE